MKIKGHPSSMRDGKPIRSSIPRQIYNEFETDDADATDAIDSIYEKPLFDEEDLRDEDRSSVAEMDAEDSANYVSVEVIQDEQAAKRAKEWEEEIKGIKKQCPDRRCSRC